MSRLTFETKKLLYEHNILKTAKIGMLTFLLRFCRLKIHKKSTKNEGFQCAVTQVKNSYNKVNANLIFTLPSKLVVLIIDHAESCFLSLLNRVFILAPYRRFSTGPAQARNQSACP